MFGHGKLGCLEYVGGVRWIGVWGLDGWQNTPPYTSPAFP